MDISGIICSTGYLLVGWDYWKAKNLTFLILMGTDKVMAAYGIRAFPITYLIDAEGIIRFQQVGEFAPSKLDAAFAKLGLE